MSDKGTGHRKRLYIWNRGTGVRLRLWMVVNVTALSLLCYLVSEAVMHQNDNRVSVSAAAHQNLRTQKVGKSTRAPVPVIPTKAELLHPHGIYFGVATPNSPWSTAELDQVARQAAARPSMTEYFVKWNQGFNPRAIAVAYQQGTVPVLTWEPWQSVAPGAKGTPSFDVNQPKYQLSKIAGGSFDTYITGFAKAVAAAKSPVVLRFAHEMNGTWYPWSEQVNGNRAGDYVKAWRHVHDLFAKAGATNVIWLWSPNIIRNLPHVKLTPLYPGDAYVDWIGVVGYGDETTAASTFDPTLQDLRRIAHKPILITETGAQPAVKARWTTSFFAWLPKNPDIIGFIWFEKDQSSGGTADWRFDADPQSLKAFAAGIHADSTGLVAPTNAVAAKPGGTTTALPAPSPTVRPTASP
ncbi:glycoside hydrolase family 26 protein [Streptacidiphilus sp. EB129]|uniref:glycoside hydrolase family 26 protein n=1 Tax=Streptacidiphilus sp. EB129 TaxID=3156262 RepID=UPI0035168382